MATAGVKMEPVREAEVEQHNHAFLDASSLTPLENICGVCGIDLGSPTTRARHEKCHNVSNRWMCAVCCVSCRSRADRAAHEKNTHGYFRHVLDADEKNAVKILRCQLSAVFNVGTKLLDTQATARSSEAIGSDLQEEEATVAELEELMRTKLHRPPRVAPCTTCGMKSFICLETREQHIRSHEAINGFTCSLCGIRKPDNHQRNFHERESHSMKRHEQDRGRKEAIRILFEDRKLFRQVGTNMKEIQRTAVPSDSPHRLPATVWQKPEKPPGHTKKTPSNEGKKKRTRSDNSLRVKRRRRSSPDSSSSDWAEENGITLSDSENDADVHKDVQGGAEIAEPPSPVASDQRVAPGLPPAQAAAQPIVHSTVDWVKRLRGQQAKAKNVQEKLQSRIRKLEEDVADKNGKLAVAAEKNAALKTKLRELESRSSSSLSKLPCGHEEQAEDPLVAEWKQRTASLEKQMKNVKAEKAALSSSHSALMAECAEAMRAEISTDNAADVLVFAARYDARELAAFTIAFAEANGGKSALLLKQPIAGLLSTNVELFRLVMKLMQ